MVLELDMRKAFDIVEWGFLARMMMTMGFDSNFCNLVYSCISTMESSLLINGGIAGQIKPSRGLRQGDPLSPLLFILCSETFSKILVKTEMERNFHSIKVARGASAISYLMYANSLLIACRARKKEVKVFQKTFDLYCKWSG